LFFDDVNDVIFEAQESLIKYYSGRWHLHGDFR